jgi:arylsulfatase A-like enzyme
MRPNLLLLCLREWRHDAAGFAGNTVIRTPNMDAVAAAGWRAEQCRAAALDPEENLRVLLRGEGGQGCIARTAQLDGYDTMAAGWTGSEELWQGYVRTARCRAPGPMPEGPIATAAFGALRAALSEAEHPVGETGDLALQLMRSAVEPFLLTVFFPAPLLPLDPPAPWDRLFDPAHLPLPRGFHLPARTEAEELFGLDFGNMTEQRFRRVLACYYGLMAYIDHQAGRIIGTLGARGMGPAVVVITAAAGHYLGEDGRTAREAAPAPCDALLRLPALVAGAQGLPAGVGTQPVTTASLHAAMRAILAGESPAPWLAMGSG